MSAVAERGFVQVKDRIEDVRRIAVLRANGIGDFLFSLPALESVRAAYSEAEIVLLGAPWHAAALNGRPSPVDRVIVVPAARGIREPDGYERTYATAPELEAFFERRRDERFDVGIQLHGGGRYSNPFVSLLGARVTVGLRSASAGELDRSLPFYHFQNEVLRWLEVAALAGAPPVRLTPAWTVTEADRREVELTLGSERRPVAVLCPGAGDARRRWPAESFAQVGDALAEKGAAVVAVGSTAERRLTSRVAAEMTRRCLDLGGLLSLGGLSALLESAHVVVANDSGSLHLARAVGTATVGIYWCGNLINAGPFGNARHRVALSWRLDCPTCGTNCMSGKCSHRSSFVSDVTVDEVLEAAVDLWGQEAGGTLREPVATVEAEQDHARCQ